MSSKGTRCPRSPKAWPRRVTYGFLILTVGMLTLLGPSIGAAASRLRTAHEKSKDGSQTGMVSTLHPDEFSSPAVVGETSAFKDVDSRVVIAGTNNGACCTSGPCGCTDNQTAAQCSDAGETFQGNGSVCAYDICGCLVRACCDPVGNCIGDVSRVACEVGSPANTWHLEASCMGAGNRPLPVCNAYDVNNCAWDNGTLLNDGGASRAHTNLGGGAAVGGYQVGFDFNTADDFILQGPDSTPCEVGQISTWFRMRPLYVVVVPDPYIDLLGINVTIFSNFIAPQTGLVSPAGHGVDPGDPTDLNPKVADVAGGIAYARTFLINDGAVTFTFLPGFCDPPPSGGFESEDVYRVDVAIDPPILLNKNLRYWLDVQGTHQPMPGQATVQTWWMPSTRNTGFRGMTFRTGPFYTDYNVGGLPTWVPNDMDLVPGGTPQQRGNQGAPAPCAALPLRTRLDFAFTLNGGKDIVGIPNDSCANAIEAFNGVAAFDNTGAITDGPAASCGAINQDVWYKYIATCDGVLNVRSCGSLFNSILAVYDGQDCSNNCIGNNDCQGGAGTCVDGLCVPYQLPSEAACGDSGGTGYAGCADDGAVLVRAHPGEHYLIRVGGTGAEAGEGLLTIECRQACGDLYLGDCCTAHAPSVGCGNGYCCEQVCSTPGMEYCCDDVGVGWNQACADFAGLTPACYCPCTFACPGGATMEPEICGEDNNGNCQFLPEGTFTPLGQLACGTPKTVCGTLKANGQADTDCWTFNVVDSNGDGEVEITLDLNASIPAGAFIVKGCTTLGCDDDMDGATDPVEFFDEVGAASCQTRSLTTCLPADADGTTYHVYLSVFVLEGDGEPEEPFFDGFPCGSGQNDYTFTLSCNEGCQTGACCTCTGGCVDALRETECDALQGTFAGEGTTCAALPAGFTCAEQDHGCQDATEITCDSVNFADLSVVNKRPDEPYVCSSVSDPDDSMWFKFTVPTGPGAPTTARIRTCGSIFPAWDSVVAVYAGSCCNQADPLSTIGCSDDDCGPLGYLGDIFMTNLVPGETYYIQVSNFDESINGVYTLELLCPGPGSCCDATNAVCMDGVASDDCQDPLLFDPQLTCAQMSPPCGIGACCHPDGTCTTTSPANCQGANDQFLGSVACSQIGGCDVFNECDYETGDPTNSFDHAVFGFRSQYAADIDLFVEIADQFELLGTSANPDCSVNSIVYATFHTSYDTANGCTNGGGPGCIDNPTDYQGIIVTISEDVSGETKGPTCKPVCTTTECTPGPDGDYHDDENIVGCQSYAFGPPVGDGDPNPAGNYWRYLLNCSGQCENIISLHFQPPIDVAKNTKQWLAITHLLPEVGKYSVNLFASNNFNGNFSQAYSSLGTQDFEELDTTPNDQLFQINGVKVIGDCANCELFGDVAPPPALKCMVDVDDLLCALDSFSGPGAFCGNALLGDIVTSGGGCGADGINDVDDLLAVLDAFAGTSHCPPPCPPGACVGDFINDGIGVTCRDGNTLGSFFVGHGMSQSDCFVLTNGSGTYCGDLTVCDPDGTCPGSP